MVKKKVSKKKNLKKKAVKKLSKMILYTVYIIGALLVLDSVITFAANLPYISQVDVITQIQIISFIGLGILQLFGVYWLVKLKEKGLYISMGLSILALVYEIFYPASHGWFIFYFFPKDLFIVFFLYRNKKIFN